MNKDTFFIRTKFEDCLFKKTCLFTQKISIVLWANERFTISVFSDVKKHATTSAMFFLGEREHKIRYENNYVFLNGRESRVNKKR